MVSSALAFGCLIHVSVQVSVQISIQVSVQVSIQVSYCWQSFLLDDNEDTSSWKRTAVDSLLDGGKKIRGQQNLYHTRVMDKLDALLGIDLARPPVPSQPSVEKGFHALVETD